jgi:signal transduction histidine kinase
MKRWIFVLFTVCMGMCLATSAIAADRGAIQGHVDSIVEDINHGKDASTVNPNDYSPYVFIMEQDGNLVVHPELTGKNLQKLAEPVYDALINSTEDGTWVDYVWKEKQKHSYVRTTDSGLIVGSGYTE